MINKAQAEGDGVKMECVYSDFGFSLHPFIKHDSGKPRYSLIPPLAEEAMAKVLTFGAQKYSVDNWRNVDDTARYVDAAMRHIGAYRAGVKFDDETGIHHLAHAMCCLAFIVELEMEKMI